MLKDWVLGSLGLFLGSSLPSVSAQPHQALFCHQGTYVLQDNSFPLLITMGSGSQYLEEAPKVLGNTGNAICPSPARPLAAGPGVPSSHSGLCLPS